MAKDKSKKKSGDSGDFARPSDAPATGGDSWRLEVEDNIGKLFLITPLRETETKGFEDKETMVVVADVVEINEKKPEKSIEHEGIYLWGGWVKGAVRGYIGEQMVLARLEQDKSKGRGKNAAWVLEDADADDAKAARAYLATVDPFKVKKGEGKPGKPSGGDAKSEKKGKKKKG